MSALINLKQSKLIGVKTSIFTIFSAEKYDESAIPMAWQEFFTKVKGAQLETLDIFYGASIPNMSADVPMDYFAGCIVDIDHEVPSGFESVEIPAGEYLCHLHLGPISNLAASYAKAYTETLPSSGREMRPAPHLEIYDSKYDPMSDDYHMQIGMPVN